VNRFWRIEDNQAFLDSKMTFSGVCLNFAPISTPSAKTVPGYPRNCYIGGEIFFFNLANMGIK
jgi:hypothetical protein